MLMIVVRSKRDADAVRACIKRFYEGWELRVETAKGRRGAELAEAVKEAAESSSDYAVVGLISREDLEALEHEEELPFNAVLHPVPRARVRNLRLEHLFHEIERGKARLRGASWSTRDRSYLLLHRGRGLYDPEPAYDPFLGLGEGFRRRLEEVLGGPLGENPLLVRMYGGEHLVFSGPYLVGSLSVPDEGCEPRGSRLLDKAVDVPLDRLIEANRGVLEALERISLSLLGKAVHELGVKEVFVPLSGGKDSAVALALASKLRNLVRVTAVYVDTTVDFEENREAAEKIASTLGVDLVVFRAPIRDELPRLGLPSNDNRWCTKLKIKALYEGIDGARSAPRDKTLIVVGDRDAESELRSRRPPVRRHEEFWQVAPLKLWSAAHVQLYLAWRRLPVNRLYLEGFYRTGCYICPALRSWEVYVMIKSRLARKLSGDPWFREFMDARRRAAPRTQST